jgi:uncharacterized Ntn-hydrolase superfamily protein
MTFSIVARDPSTGALGVAVQTCMFAVGKDVPWACAGVGAVATQAFGEPAYGPRCLDRMRDGASASEALADAQRSDPASFLRQVGVVGADGTADAITGEWCIDHAGHLLGDAYAVQGNMLAGPDVLPAMARAYETSAEPFARRLLRALQAAQLAGGDARGVMSAALVVVDGEPNEPWAGRPVDLRIDRSDDPIGELSHLLDAAHAFAAYHRAADALFAGDAQGALAEVDAALTELPGDENMRFLRSGALAATGNFAQARDELKALVAQRPSFETLVHGFAAKGLLTLPPGETIDSILA